MSAIIFNEEITKENYTEFVEKIVNIFRLSSSDKYILFSLKLIKQECVIDLSVLRNDGNNEVFDPIHMDSNSEYFYDFIKVLVDRLRESLEIVKEDIVNLDDDHYVAFRMITKFNDLITIDGLAESQANKILKGEKERDKVPMGISNNVGGSSVLGFLVMLTFIVLSFIAVVMIVD